MENTLINKQKFFALYWGQKVAHYQAYHPDERHFVHLSIHEHEHLELTPLSAITVEDAEYVKRLKVICHVDGSHDLEPFQHTTDYLRSKGYAVPYMDLSVEQMVEYGWVKLKSQATNGQQ